VVEIGVDGQIALEQPRIEFRGFGDGDRALLAVLPVMKADQSPDEEYRGQQHVHEPLGRSSQVRCEPVHEYQNW